MHLPKLIVGKDHTPDTLIVLHDVAAARVALMRSFKHTPAHMWPVLVAAHARLTMQQGRPNKRADLIQLAAMACAAAETFNESAEVAGPRRCRRCGCTDDQACVVNGSPCYWTEADLCSNCDVILNSQENERRHPIAKDGGR